MFKPPDLFWHKWTDAWFKFYQAKNDGIKPMFNGIQGSALKTIRQHLESISKEKFPEKDKEQGGLESWNFILSNWNRLDPWIQNQFDLTVVGKKMNDIINQLKNGIKSTSGNRSNGNDELLAKLKEELQS